MRHPRDDAAYPWSNTVLRGASHTGTRRNMANSTTLEAVWKSGKGKLLVLWFGLDAVLYLGALMTLVLALTDSSVRPVTYGFTIALVTSWASRMAYGIWFELRRVR